MKQIDIDVNLMLSVAGGILIAVGVLFVLGIVVLGVVKALDETLSVKWSKAEQQGCFGAIVIVIIALLVWLLD